MPLLPAGSEHTQNGFEVTGVSCLRIHTGASSAHSPWCYAVCICVVFTYVGFYVWLRVTAQIMLC